MNSDVTPAKRYFFYTPERNLLSESELTTLPAPTILYDYVWFNGHPVGQINGGTQWTFTDQLGTPLIQTDTLANVFWRAEHEPYGKVFALRGTPDQHQPLRLPGQEAEQLNLGENGASERFYNIFRWYRYGWGRYTQSDPTARFRAQLYPDLIGRSLADPLLGSNYQWLLRTYPRLDPGNLYGYVDGGPVNFFDPYGLERFTPTPVPYPGPVPTPTPVPGGPPKCRVFPKHIINQSAGFCRDTSLNFFHGGQECYRQLGYGWHVCYNFDDSCDYHWDHVNPCKCPGRGSDGTCTGCGLFQNPRGWDRHIGDDVIPSV